MRALFVRRSAQSLGSAGALALLLLLSGCGTRKNAVSGTIEVDEAHVGPRQAARGEKFWRGKAIACTKGR
jgi:hypothetical protein